MHLPRGIFSALVCHNAHSKGEHKELLSLDSLSPRVWRYKLSPQRSVLYSCTQSTEFVSAKALEASVTEAKEGVMFQGKMTAAGGSHYLPWYWQHSGHPISSINSLQAGVAQTHQSRAWSSPSHINLIIWLSSRIQEGLFLLKLPVPEGIEERYRGDFRLEGGKRGSLSVRKVTELPASCRKH